MPPFPRSFDAAQGCPEQRRGSRATTLPLAAPLIETRLNGLVPQRQGKVRDIFDCGERLVMVATDRISAFDYVLGSGIPDKGKVLTQLSSFWFERTTDIVANHFLSADVREYPEETAAAWRHPQRPLDARAQDGTRCRLSASRAAISRDRAGRNTSRRDRCAALPLPAGLRESDRLPTPIFTPATKADSGHDINISEHEAGRIVGVELIATASRSDAGAVRPWRPHAEANGIILADTKFEFGLTGATDRSC